MSEPGEQILTNRLRFSEADSINIRNGFSIKPSLFIGLGGIGAQAVSKIKALFEQLPEANPIPTFYAFRAFDTDRQSCPTNLIPKYEWIGIGVEDLAGFYDTRQNDPEFRDWLLKLYLFGFLGYPGPCRNLGRAVLLANVDEVVKALSSAQRQVLTAAAAGAVNAVFDPSPIIYIFGSLSGGTGAGCYLDICFLLRQLFPANFNPSFVGFVGVLDGFPSMPGRTKKTMAISTYAALKEFNAFMDKSYQLPPNFPQTLNYPSNIMATVTQPLDECYLISPQQWYETRSLPTHGHVSSFMARLAFMMSTSVFPGPAPNFPTMMTVFRPDFRQRFKGTKACYAIPGMAQIHFPIDTVAAMFALKATTDYLKYMTGGDALAGDEGAQSFVKLNRLEYNYLLGQIKRDPKDDNREVAATFYDGVIVGFFKDSKTRYKNREQILAYGQAMPDGRANEIEEYLAPNVTRIFDEVWGMIRSKTTASMVKDGVLLTGTIDFLKDLKELLTQQHRLLSEVTKTTLDPEIRDMRLCWATLQSQVDDVCTDEGILDRVLDSFKTNKVADAYIQLLNQAEVLVLQKSCNELCHDLLTQLIDALEKEITKLHDLATQTLPGAIDLLMARHTELATRLHQQSGGTDASVFDVCSFNAISQEWRDAVYKESSQLQPKSVQQNFLEKNWHPVSLLDVRPAADESVELVVAQQVLDKVLPLTDQIRTMSNMKILEKCAGDQGRLPEEIIGTLYNSVLQPQMQATNMKNRLDVDLSKVVFCGGIDPDMKKVLEDSPHFVGTELHVAYNFEDRRIAFFSVSLPVALAGCDMVTTNLREAYRQWCEDISKLPESKREYEIRKYHCFPGSFDWPDPCECMEELDEELQLFAKALAVSEFVPVGEADQANLEASCSRPKDKSFYGIFQLGKSQFWLMPYFEPYQGAQIPGKPIRLGFNVIDAFAKFRESTEHKNYARQWVQWFEENCFGMYRMGQLKALQKQFIESIHERKDKTSVPRQRDLYDQIAYVVGADELWDLG